MSTNNSCVAVFKNHTDAETAIKELGRADFDMQKLSIVGKGYKTEEHAVGYYNAGDRIKYWGKLGAFWGGIWGILFGSAFFFIPGIGPLFIAGPLISAIVGAAEGVVMVGGLSALGAGLYSLGIPHNSIIRYETALKAENFLLIAHGTQEEVNRAKAILEGSVDVQVDLHISDESAKAAA